MNVPLALPLEEAVVETVLLALKEEELDTLSLKVGVTERLLLRDTDGEFVAVSEAVTLSLTEQEELPLAEEVNVPLALPLEERVVEPVLLGLREDELDSLLLKVGVTERLSLGDADGEFVAVSEAVTLSLAEEVGLLLAEEVTVPLALPLEEAVVEPVLLGLREEELDSLSLKVGVTERLPLKDADGELVGVTEAVAL